MFISHTMITTNLYNKSIFHAMDFYNVQSIFVYKKYKLDWMSWIRVSTFSPDPEMLKALAPWKVSVDEKAKTKIARSRVFLDNKCRRNECNLGNLITDAMVDAVRKYFVRLLKLKYCSKAND